MPKLYPGIRRYFLFIAMGAPSLAFAQPVITAISPLSGALNSTVTITGSNFSSTASNNIVWFGSVPAPVTSASSGSLTVTVPPGASYQPITITSNNLSSYPFKPFITTFSDTGQFKPSAFSSTTTIPTGNGPQSIFSIDLDGDGKPDLLIADGDSNIITVYHNNSTPGSISFAPQGSIIMGSDDYPIGITAGDLDGDGKPDIVVSNFYSQNISIFRNTSTSGHITLAAPITLAAGNYATAATIADLNGDGKPEIIVACGGSDYLSTYKNNSTVGSLSFSAKVNWTVPSGSAPFKVEVADIDGDGLPDMVTANGNTNLVSVFRNTSTGAVVSFSTHVDFATGNAPQGLAIGDLDGDGKPDLAVANNNDNTLSLLHNTSSSGTVSFATQQVVNTGSGAYDLVITDLDGDGKPDLAVDDESGSTVSVHKNISIVGAIAINPNVDYATGNVPFAITTADYDGDGRPDLATANNTDATITILRNKGSNEPGINSFSPAIGAAGTVVTITGANLSGITGVSFGGTTATSFTLVSSTTITAIVGTGATGAVTVTTTTGTLSLPGFTYGIPPSISSITPDSGATGATILVSGTGFTGTSILTFGGTPANSFTVLSDTTISAIVGAGSAGSVAITTPTDTASIGGFSYIYTPLPPVQLTSFSPDSAGPGTTIAIMGQNLSGITSISFGGTSANLFNIISDTLVYAIVGQGSTGALVVNGNNGEDSLTGFIYIPPPPPPPGIALTGFSPTSGTTGATITITGHYLTGATSVTFGGTQVSSFNVVSDSVIAAVVGAGNTGNVWVASVTSSAALPGFVYLYDTTRTVPPPPAAAFQLQSFSGTYSNNYPLLQWQATNDAILSYYALERAIDGDTTQFAVIATISPNGIDTGTQTYSFSDPGANPGINYYRLKMQDSTAIYSYSNTIKVQPAGKAALLNLYPNPVKLGWTDVVLPDASTASWFQVIDMTGRPGKAIPVPAGIPMVRVDLSGLIPGVYKLTWSDGKHSACNLVLVLPLN